MASVRDSYNSWANQYDTNINATRDLEATALIQMLGGLDFESCLELGCGTGKNTAWLMTRAKKVTAVDLSEEMLQKARNKVQSPNVEFVLANLNEPWDFLNRQYQLVTFSLVLEHIQDLSYVFSEASKKLLPGGWLYIGELHPFKQYNGSKARFETDSGTITVECYTHNISDFFRAGRSAGMNVINLEELFDTDDRTSVPRILSLLFQKDE